MSMKIELLDYIKKFQESTSVLEEQVGNALDFAEKIAPEEIEHFLITEYKDSKGMRTFESLFFFTRKYLIEFRRILSEGIRVDMTCFFLSIDLCNIASTDYNFTSGEEDSKLNIEASINNIFFELKATHWNCDRLWSIFTSVIKPNLVEYYSVEELST